MATKKKKKQSVKNLEDPFKILFNIVPEIVPGTFTSTYNAVSPQSHCSLKHKNITLLKPLISLKEL